jgi:sigma-B regulation protein RsbQ
MWRYVTPAFSDQYLIVLFDHVGCGKSDPAAFSKSRYTSLRGYARDVLEIIEEQALEKVTFAGHSVSSMIGALAAIERPELFENLVMIGPSPCYINDGECLGGFERADIDGCLKRSRIITSAGPPRLRPSSWETPHAPNTPLSLPRSPSEVRSFGGSVRSRPEAQTDCSRVSVRPSAWSAFLRPRLQE